MWQVTEGESRVKACSTPFCTQKENICARFGSAPIPMSVMILPIPLLLCQFLVPEATETLITGQMSEKILFFFFAPAFDPYLVTSFWPIDSNHGSEGVHQGGRQDVPKVGTGYACATMGMDCFGIVYIEESHSLRMHT